MIYAKKEGYMDGSEMGRKKLAVKNGAFAAAFSLITYFLSFINRKVFVVTLGSTYLGYEGLFSNIFVILGTAEAGMISLLYYALYKAYADNDEKEISNLMTVHKYYYMFVGIFVLVIGAGISFLLPDLITGNEFDWGFVYRIYFIQLISMGTTYFLTYRRTLFTVAQLGYVCVKVDGICTLVAAILKIGILYFTRNYYLYLMVGLVYNLTSNIIVSYIYKRYFPNIKKSKISWEYVKKRGFAKDLYNMLVSTLAGKIWSSTDSIVISKFINVGAAGLYSNYFMISSSVDVIIAKTVYGISPATGNFVNTESKERVLDLYNKMNLFFYFLGVFVACGFATIFQPFITIWLGEEYLLPYSYIICLSINSYITWNHYFMSILRGTYAHFEVDKIAYSLSAISNIVISVILVRFMGITGVAIGTIAGNLFFWIGRAYVVHKYIIIGKTLHYIKNEMIKIAGAAIQIAFVVFITYNIDYTFIGLIIRIAIIIVVLTISDLIICFINPSGHRILEEVKKYLKKKCRRG